MSGNIAMPFCWLEWRNLLREKQIAMTSRKIWRRKHEASDCKSKTGSEVGGMIICQIIPNPMSIRRIKMDNGDGRNCHEMRKR